MASEKNPESAKLGRTITRNCPKLCREVPASRTQARFGEQCVSEAGAFMRALFPRGLSRNSPCLALNSKPPSLFFGQIKDQDFGPMAVCENEERSRHNL